eukprot:jgi/Botrbrau1/20793/Bobra.0156s0023.1
MAAAGSGSQDRQMQEAQETFGELAETILTAQMQPAVGHGLGQTKALDVTPTQVRGPMLIQPETPQPVPFKLGAATSASVERASTSYPIPNIPYIYPSPVWPTPVLHPPNVRRLLNLDAMAELPQASVVESVGTSGNGGDSRGAISNNAERSSLDAASPPECSFVEGQRGDTSEASTPSLSSSPLPASDSTSDFERLLLQVSDGQQASRNPNHREAAVVDMSTRAAGDFTGGAVSLGTLGNETVHDEGESPVCCERAASI